MLVYRIKSGDKFYDRASYFNEDEYGSPLFTNRGKVEKKIRDERSILKAKEQYWPEHPGLEKLYEQWSVARVVTYELVEKDI